MDRNRGSEKRKHNMASQEDSLPETNADSKRAKRSENEMDDAHNELNSDLTTKNYKIEVGFILSESEPFYFDRNPEKMTRLYDAINKSDGRPIVVKRQPANAVNMRELEVLKAFQSSPYCPVYYGDWRQGPDMYIGMEKLILDFWDVQHKVSDNRFSLGSACRLIIQGLDAIQHLHGVGYVHSDIKPSNFMLKDVRSDADDIVRLIDFGLSRPCRMVDEGPTGSKVQVLPPKYLGSLIGTPRYASPSVHELYEPSRIDDLISLFYTFYEMVHEHLPWEHLEMDPKNYPTMGKWKRGCYSMRFLAKQIDPVMIDWVEYVSQLNYDDTPDYEYLKNCFRAILYKENDSVYDWIEENTFN